MKKMTNAIGWMNAYQTPCDACDVTIPTMLRVPDMRTTLTSVNVMAIS